MSTSEIIALSTLGTALCALIAFALWLIFCAFESHAARKAKTRVDPVRVIEAARWRPIKMPHVSLPSRKRVETADDP